MSFSFLLRNLEHIKEVLNITQMTFDLATETTKFRNPVITLETWRLRNVDRTEPVKTNSDCSYTE